MMHNETVNRKHQGFSLLEVLVALSLLAMLLGGLMRVSSVTLNTVAVTENYQLAVLVANSILAEIEASNSAIDQYKTGSVDKNFRWQANVTPYYEGNDQPGMVQPYKISVQVEWGAGERVRHVTIDSVRLLRS